MVEGRGSEWGVWSVRPDLVGLFVRVSACVVLYRSAGVVCGCGL